MKTRPKRSEAARGFTLIELLIVVAIIGIIAAIALPNLFGALERARQKRSMADLRVIAEVTCVYQQDNSMFPAVGTGPVTILIPHLTPHYVQVLPVRDGWGYTFMYDSADGERFTVVSLGSNRAPDLPYILGSTGRFRDDIVISNGAFTQWPEGLQRE